MKKEFKFDCKMFAIITVEAETEADARDQIRDKLDCAFANFGAWVNGEPITGEASMEGDPDLIEIDGESV